MGFGPSPMELAIIAVIALIVLGPARLPEMAKSLGKGMRELRGAFSGEGGETSSRKLHEADEDDEDEFAADEEDDDLGGNDPDRIDLDAADEPDNDDDLDFQPSSSDVDERSVTADAEPAAADAKPAA